MVEYLDGSMLEDAIIGGLVLSAGGSGMGKVELNRRIGTIALGYSPLAMVGLDELPDDAPIIITTGVGAPGFSNAITSPRDAVQSAQMLLQAAQCRQPAGVMPGHVPGLMSWLPAAVLGIPLVDAATNGRGHPTVKMGGMGLASKPEIAITQAACGGRKDDRVEVVVTGSLAKTSSILRAASVQNGGSLYATRGPFTAGFIRRNGAPGAVSFAIGMGHAMRECSGGLNRIEAAAAYLQGTVLVTGQVERNDVRYDAGFDVGVVVVAGDSGRFALHVYNEFMAVDCDGERVCTFPDMVGSFDLLTGDPVSIKEMTPGRPVAIVQGPRDAFPVGAGAKDPAVFPEVEAKLGIALSA